MKAFLTKHRNKLIYTACFVAGFALVIYFYDEILALLGGA